MTNNVYPIILRAKDGREKTDLWLVANDEVRKHIYDRARKNGLEVIEHDNEK